MTVFIRNGTTWHSYYPWPQNLVTEMKIKKSSWIVVVRLHIVLLRWKWLFDKYSMTVTRAILLKSKKVKKFAFVPKKRIFWGALKRHWKHFLIIHSCPLFLRSWSVTMPNLLHFFIFSATSVAFIFKKIRYFLCTRFTAYNLPLDRFTTNFCRKTSITL
jgi:hypothetical protein